MEQNDLGIAREPYTLKNVRTVRRGADRNLSQEYEKALAAYPTFHVHGLQFQVISRDGTLPPEGERGWKDTVFLKPGETVEILVKFTLEGIFMYHCHNLEHEDAGMMGQFQVVE